MDGLLQSQIGSIMRSWGGSIDFNVLCAIYVYLPLTLQMKGIFQLDQYLVSSITFFNKQSYYINVDDSAIYIFCGWKMVGS